MYGTNLNYLQKERRKRDSGLSFILEKYQLSVEKKIPAKSTLKV
jgi:hypothetical protein